MNERDLELTGLVLARELLLKRGTDISELEREIDRITQPAAAARGMHATRRAAPSSTRRATYQLLT